MNKYTSFAVFCFFAIALIIPSGFSFGAVLLTVGAVTLLKRDNGLRLNKQDRILIAVLLFYFLVSAMLNALHGEGIKEYDLPSRFLYAVPALLLLRAYPPAPIYYWAGLIVGGVLAGCFAGWQYLYLGYRAGGHTNPIQYGDISFTTGILCLTGLQWAQMRCRAKIWVCLLIVGAIMGLLGSLFTESRGSWVALPICLGVLYHYYGGIFAKKYVIGGIGLLIVFFCIIYATPETGVRTRAELAVKEARDYLYTKNAVTSIGVRMEMWRTALVVIPESPWLGWGKTGFVARESELIKEGKIDAFMQDNNHVYNEWLDAMVKRGLPGLIAVLALYFVPLGFFIRDLKRGNAMQRPYALGGVLLVVCFIGFGFSQVFMAHNTGVMTFGFTAVILWGLSRAHSTAQQ